MLRPHWLRQATHQNQSPSTTTPWPPVRVGLAPRIAAQAAAALHYQVPLLFSVQRAWTFAVWRQRWTSW